MAEKGSGLAGDTMCLELGVKPEVAGRTKAVGPDLRKLQLILGGDVESGLSW